jgi:peptide-methionine (S)-S-oxide reductase
MILRALRAGAIFLEVSFMQTRIVTSILMLVVMAQLIVPALAAEPTTSKKTKSAKEKTAEASVDAKESESPARLEEATFGSGCFWCAEAVFQQIRGVKSVVSGFSGGELKNPSYQEVLTGLTGHAEVVEITFDPEVISYDELLEVFWKSHDPTRLNEQGPDHGTQYRSVIFYHSEEQKAAAEKSKQKHTRPGRTAPKIVTEITKFSEFYPAEEYHQDYFKKNPRADYCQTFIRPKVNKVKKEFKEQLKDPAAR